MSPLTVLNNEPQTLPQKAARSRKSRKERMPEHYYKDALFELEAKGELQVHKMGEAENPVETETKFGRMKKVPRNNTWHHKSCGQCGHIPGYSTSIFWIQRELGYTYHDPRDQTSCTAWNYYASATSNPVAQAAVAVRNFAQAFEDGFFPLIHCGTSYGHYKEVREELIHHPELREQLKRVMDKLKKPVVFPEEVVHYSEWLHVMRDEIAEHRILELKDITVTVHPACHYHKLVAEDAVYDEEVYEGERTSIVTALVQALGANAADYSTWHDCCGFGFRHILVSRDFSRSFATLRKIERMKEEANPDVVLTHDTGCVTTLDKSQFATQAHGCNVGVPVMSDAQFAALSIGAHPYKVCQLHWHGVDMRPLLEKMGIDHEKAWAEFEVQTERIKAGEIDYLSWEDC